MIRVVGALAAGLVLAVGPGATAFAGDKPSSPPYGNCGLNSAGGHVERTGLAGKGHGGMTDVAKADGCGLPDTPPPPPAPPSVVEQTEG